MSETSITDLIIGQFKDLKADVNKRLDKIEDKIDGLVTAEDCKNNQANCQQFKLAKLEVQKREWSYKKYIAVIGIFSGFFGILALIMKGLFGWGV